MKKILFISLAMVLALSVGLIGCGGEDGVPEIPDQPETLVIATARDTDESLAIFEAVAAGELHIYAGESCVFYLGLDGVLDVRGTGGNAAGALAY